MQKGWMKQSLGAKKKMDLSLKNVKKHIHEEFIKLHTLAPSSHHQS